MNRHHRKMLLNIATGVAVAATATVVFLPAANAAPGTVTSNINVRSGPGTNFGVIDTVRAGTQVDVQQCQGSWCFIVKPGPDGWVSSTYLSGGTGGGGGGGSNQPGINFGIQVPGGPSINFGVGNDQNQRPPRPPIVRPQPVPVYSEVCFYDRTRFRGASFCMEPGDSIRDLGDWTDRISSIDNPDGVQVQICTDVNFRGCRTYTTSASSLGDLDDYSTSIRLR